MDAPATTPSQRVFIDSSVLLAAALSEHGSARDLLMAGFGAGVTLIISSLVIEETERNLAKKAPQALPDYHALRDVLPVEVVDPPPSLIAQVAQTIESKDAPIVAAAIAGHATSLATYDRRHLLAHADQISRLYEIEAETPDEILRAID